MKKTIGKVVNVFIPEEYKDGVLLDVMNRKNVGFQVETDEGVKEFVFEQDASNCDIYKDDMVLITEQNVSGVDFIDIELLGEEDE